MSAKDDTSQLGPFSRKELSMLIVSIAIGIVLVTYSVAIIVGMTDSDTKITVTGSIDLNMFQTTVFSIVGAGIILLGIAAGNKLK